MKEFARRALVSLLLLTASSLLAAASQAPPKRPFPMVGMLEWKRGTVTDPNATTSRSSTLWLMTSDTTLAPGDSLTLLWNTEDADTEYQHSAPVLQRGRVVGRAGVGPSGPGNMHPDSGDVFYQVAAPEPGAFADPGLGFAVGARLEEFRLVGDRVEADLDGDGVAERFFQCASYEGVHLTVWSGEPKKGKKRWHRYYYVPYDTEPTCFYGDSTEAPTHDD